MYIFDNRLFLFYANLLYFSNILNVYIFYLFDNSIILHI